MTRLVLLTLLALVYNVGPSEARGGITVAGTIAGCPYPATASTDGCAGAPTAGLTGASVKASRATVYGTCPSGSSNGYTCDNGAEKFTGGGVGYFLSGLKSLPNWNIAGIDYFVGIPAGETLQDPRDAATAPTPCATNGGSAGSLLPAACSGRVNWATMTGGKCTWTNALGGYVSCSFSSGDACPTITNVDLSVNGGTYINLQGNCTGAYLFDKIFQTVGANSLTSGSPITLDNLVTSITLTLQNSYFDANGFNQDAGASVIAPARIIDSSYGAAGSFTSTRNAFVRNSGTRPLNWGVADLLSQYDYYEGFNTNNIATHGEEWYWGGGTTGTWRASYTTFWSGGTYGGGGTAWTYLAPGGNGHSMVTLEFDHLAWAIEPFKFQGYIAGSTLYATSTNGTGITASYPLWDPIAMGGTRVISARGGNYVAQVTGQLSQTGSYPGGAGSYSLSVAPGDVGSAGSPVDLWTIPGGGGVFQLGGNGTITWTNVKLTNSFLFASGARFCFFDNNAGGGVTNWTVSGNTDMGDGTTALAYTPGANAPTGCNSARP